MLSYVIKHSLIPIYYKTGFIVTIDFCFKRIIEINYENEVKITRLNGKTRMSNEKITVPILSCLKNSVIQMVIMIQITNYQ